MPQSRLLLVLARRYAAGIWIGAAAIAGAGIAGSMWDVRWLIVALMLLLVLAPGVAALLYLGAATRPVSAANTLPHRIEFDPDGLRLMIRPLSDDTLEDSETATEEARSVAVAVPYTDIRSIGTDSSAITVRLTDRQFVGIPYSAFSNPDHLAAVAALLRSKTNI